MPPEDLAEVVAFYCITIGLAILGLSMVGAGLS